MATRALIAGVSGIVGNNLAAHLVSKGWEVHGLARKPPGRHPGGASDRRRPARARVAAGRPGRRRPHPRLHHDLAAPGHRGRELRGERRHGAEPAGRRRLGREPPARRPRHRPEALPRAVRGLREGQAGDAVPRGDAAPARRELLLHAGGRALRGRRAAGLRLERASPAHDHRLRPRQRHEHGRHPRRLRHDLPRDRPPVRLPRLAPAMGGADRRDRRPGPRAAPGMGRDLRGRPESGVQHRQRRHLPLELAVAEARGRLRDRGRPVSRAARRRSSRNWRTRGRSGPRSRRSTASPSPTSTSSRRPGTPTWTSGARSRS